MARCAHAIPAGGAAAVAPMLTQVLGAAGLGVLGHGQPGGARGVVVGGGLGVEEADAGEQAAVPLGEGEDDVAAHRDPGDDGAVDPGGAQGRGDGVGVGLQGRLGRSADLPGDGTGVRRVAEAGRVDRDDGEVGQQGDDLVPHPGVEREGVQQNERKPLVGAVAVQGKRHGPSIARPAGGPPVGERVARSRHHVRSRRTATCGFAGRAARDRGLCGAFRSTRQRVGRRRPRACQHALCQWRRSSMPACAPSRWSFCQATTCAMPGGISWSQPGQR
jgi:hypothetical protein